MVGMYKKILGKKTLLHVYLLNLINLSQFRALLMITIELNLLRLSKIQANLLTCPIPHTPPPSIPFSAEAH